MEDEPGTRVSVTWSDQDAAKRQVERHVETGLQATVEPAPYVQRGRRNW